MCLSSVSHELREATQALLQQLRTGHEAASALCLKMGMRCCKELREAKYVSFNDFNGRGLSAADLETLGTLGSVLLALKELLLTEPAAVGLDGVQRLAAGLGAGALPAVTNLQLTRMHVGDAGASALAAALGRGALPRLNCLVLCHAGIGDAGMVGLAAAARASLYLSRRQPVRRRGHRRTRGAAAAGRCAATAEGSADEAHGSLPRPHPDHRRRLRRPRHCARQRRAAGAQNPPPECGTFASAAAKAVMNEARDNLYGCLSDSESEEDEDEEDEEDDGEGN